MKQQLSPDTIESDTNSNIIEEVLTATAQFYFEKLTQEVKDYLIIKRCLTEETINRYKIGYAPAREIGNSSGLLSFLKERGYTKRQAIIAGVLCKDGRECFAGNIIFPNWKLGRVVYIIGQGFPDRSLKNLPNVNVPMNHLFLEEKLTGKEGIIPEGPPDTYTLRQAGFNAIGILGVSGFKDEWAQKFKKLDTVYIALYDESGIKASIKLGKLLGEKARIVPFPDFYDKNGKKTKDWNELFCIKYKGNIQSFRTDFQQILDQAQTVLEFQIKQIPKDINKREFCKVLSPFMPRLTDLSEIELGFYIDVIHNHFKDTLKIPRQSIKNEIKQFRRVISDISGENEEIIDDKYPRISPALDFTENVAYVTMPIDVKRTSVVKGQRVTEIASVPYLITSEKEFIRVNKMELFEKKGLVIKSEPFFLDGNRWSRYHVKEFQDGFQVDPFVAFQVVKAIFEDYIDFAESQVAEVLSLWVIGTYIFRIFESYPYIFLKGEMGTGKTRILTIVDKISFNAIYSSSISTASLFRTIESCSPTILLDEAEALKTPSRSQDLRLVLDSGYKRGAKVYRVNKDTHKPQSFEVFSPKIIANIKGLEKVLVNRCIKFTMVKTADTEKANKNVSELGEDWGYIRHLLYSFALTFFKEIRDIYSSDPDIKNIHTISGREAELWFPLLTIAKFIDKNGCDGLFDMIKNVAFKKSQESRSEEIDYDTRALLLGLRDLTEYTEDSISNKQIGEKMIDYLENRNFPSSHWIGSTLKKFGLIEQSNRTNSGYKYVIRQKILSNMIDRYAL